MIRFARSWLIVLLAIFAASTVTLAANATAMSVTMALAGSDAMDMSDCEGCGHGGVEVGATCEMSCASPFVATVHADTALERPASGCVAARGASDLAGRTGPPDPDPPRVRFPS